jgi:hypothetical protein
LAVSLLCFGYHWTRKKLGRSFHYCFIGTCLLVIDWFLCLLFTKLPRLNEKSSRSLLRFIDKYAV